jgi:hypothetical protein
MKKTMKYEDFIARIQRIADKSHKREIDDMVGRQEFLV